MVESRSPRLPCGSRGRHRAAARPGSAAGLCGGALRSGRSRCPAFCTDRQTGAGIRAAAAARPCHRGACARTARRAVHHQRVGQLVPCLPRRTPGAEPLRTDQARARDRLQLEGRAQRCAALARTTRQPVSAGGRRSRWPHRHRFRHRRRTGNLPGRRAWGGALEVQRHADPIHHRHPVDSGAEPDRTFPTAAPDLHAKQ